MRREGRGTNMKDVFKSDAQHMVWLRQVGQEVRKGKGEGEERE